jgi:all-trans-retinol 13,14-reductase
MKVLVLEKQSERGGLTHVFRRDGASWDVGVHYMGHMDKGSTIRSLFNFLSGGALEWNRMPVDFEDSVYPNLKFAVPSDPKRYQEQVIARFPHESTAIRRYFSDIQKAANRQTSRMMRSMLPWPFGYLLALWNRWNEALALETTGKYLDQHFKSKELKALLATQWGDYGLPPCESAFAIHSLVVRSYLHGAYSPRNRACRIARRIEVAIEEQGGAIKVCHEVKSILTHGTRAVGVKALDQRGAAEPVEVTLHAPIVISDSGPDLPPHVHSIGSRRRSGLSRALFRLPPWQRGHQP